MDVYVLAPTQALAQYIDKLGYPDYERSLCIDDEPTRTAPMTFPTNPKGLHPMKFLHSNAILLLSWLRNHLLFLVTLEIPLNHLGFLRWKKEVLSRAY